MFFNIFVSHTFSLSTVTAVVFFLTFVTKGIEVNLSIFDGTLSNFNVQTQL